ncbi:MAG TPA: oxalate decarboxylase family bicupin [Bryobacteraceae bacterium]|nr:oxalate decarboxylase family bicupin [Bryobacteraceae bacterium]
MPVNRTGETASNLQPAPQPIRGNDGATDTGPRNVVLDRQNPDMLVPPATDHGTVPNLKFSFSNVHNRLEEGGWAREITVRELPIATALAGVNMRLKPGGIRELHWHKEAEWAYMLSGKVRVTAVDQDGHNFIDDVEEGDIWYFPPGIPHSIQALAEGAEFLLVFSDGHFSENSTFLVTDWFAHLPRQALAVNFGLPESAFENLPKKEKYIFSAPVPPPLERQDAQSPAGPIPQPMTYHMLRQEPIRTKHGTVRIVDSHRFPVSTMVAAALVEVEPGAMRELHWHPTTDEWQYYISGQARMTVFAADTKARTFNMQAGDVGYVPFAMGHYIQNTGNTTLRFLEMFRSDRYADISLNQWLALLPPDLVRQHLNVGNDFLRALHKDKRPIV